MHACIHTYIHVIYDTAHGLTQLEAFDIEGCGYQAFLWEAKARTILVVAVYFKTNETIQGATNSQILARILALLQATNRQFILVGDWNNHPAGGFLKAQSSAPSFTGKSWPLMPPCLMATRLTTPLCTRHLPPVPP